MGLQQLDIAVDEDALAFLESADYLVSIAIPYVWSIRQVKTHLPQFKGSTKVPGLSQTKGLQDFPPFLRTLLKGLSPLLPCRSESRQGSEHAQGCTQAIWLGQ